MCAHRLEYRGKNGYTLEIRRICNFVGQKQKFLAKMQEKMARFIQLICLHIGKKCGDLPMNKVHKYLPGDCRGRRQGLLWERG